MAKIIDENVKKVGNQMNIKIKDVDFDIFVKGIDKKQLKRMAGLINKTVHDPRKEGMRWYNLSDIICIVFFASLCGCENWNTIEDWALIKRDWLKTFLELPTVVVSGRYQRDIPAHDTFERVFSLLDTRELEKVTVKLARQCFQKIKKLTGIRSSASDIKQLCVDGKSENGSGRNFTANSAEPLKKTQLLHFYDRSEGITLFSVPIDKKTNEIPEAQKVLRLMDLRKTVVTFDAMNTQTDTIKAIVESKGDYVGGLKGNQDNSLQEAVSLFTEKRIALCKKNPKRYYVTKEKAHSSVETREYFLSKKSDGFFELERFENIRSVVMVHKKIEHKNGEIITEDRYYITSLTDIELIADAIRGHWACESNHFDIDFNFHEDDQTTTNTNALANLSAIHKMVISLLKLADPIYHKVLRNNGPISIRRKLNANRIDSPLLIGAMLEYLDLDSLDTLIA